LRADHRGLRTALPGALLDGAGFTLAQGAERVALSGAGRSSPRNGRSEVGGVLGGESAGERPPPAFEPQSIAALAVGPVVPQSWADPAGPGREAEEPAGFYRIEGGLEALGAQLGAGGERGAAGAPF